jgi:hypothetical protein
MGSTDSPTNPELSITISQEEPRTLTISRVALQRVHPAWDPSQAPRILPQTFHKIPAETASEGVITDSPSKSWIEFIVPLVFAQSPSALLGIPILEVEKY